MLYILELNIFLVRLVLPLSLYLSDHFIITLLKKVGRVLF